MFYGNEKFIRAHQSDIPYYNHHYDRHVREAFCSCCRNVIGEQVKYEFFYEDFKFGNEKDNYIYCPYCGHKFK